VNWEELAPKTKNKDLWQEGTDHNEEDLPTIVDDTDYDPEFQPVVANAEEFFERVRVDEREGQRKEGTNDAHTAKIKSNERDASPPRKDRRLVEYNDPIDQDASPPRKIKRDAAAAEDDIDASPPRRCARRKNEDPSPPRKQRQSNIKEDDDDASPPRRRSRRKTEDPSPPKQRRLNINEDDDVSQPVVHSRSRKISEAASPPRKQKQPQHRNHDVVEGYDASPPRRKTASTDIAADASPPRRKKTTPSRFDRSRSPAHHPYIQKENESASSSPRRRRNGDNSTSPPRRRRSRDRRSRSRGRRHGKHSPSHHHHHDHHNRRRSRSVERGVTSGSCSSVTMDATLRNGHKVEAEKGEDITIAPPKPSPVVGGIFTGQEFHKEQERARQSHEAAFANEELMGKQAETIYRDKRGRHDYLIYFMRIM
jgi:pre-mRNA-splicing factor CWC26